MRKAVGHVTKSVYINDTEVEYTARVNGIYYDDMQDIDIVNIEILNYEDPSDEIDPQEIYAAIKADVQNQNIEWSN